MYNPYTGAVYYGGNDYRDYLAHSKGPWISRATKYIKKIGEGANAVYVYAKDKVTGASHARNAAQARTAANVNQYRANQARSASNIAKVGTAASNREYNYRTSNANEARARAASEEAAYRRSLHYRTLRAVNTIKLSKPYKTAKKAIKSAAGAVRGAIGTIRQTASRLITRGKNLVNGLMAKARYHLDRGRRARTSENKDNVYERNVSSRRKQRAIGVQPEGATYPMRTVSSYDSRNVSTGIHARTVEQDRRRRARRRGIAQ